jgi:hypothetical protein
MLKMLGGVRDRQPDALREPLDAPLALRKLLKQLQTVRVRRRLRHGGELREERPLRVLP